MNATQLHNLAVLFRVDSSHNLRHVNTYAAIATIGGEIAIKYGYWTATEFRRKKQGKEIALEIADMLDHMAAALDELSRKSAPLPGATRERKAV